LGLGVAVVTLAWAIPSIVKLSWGLFLEGTFLAPLRHSAFMHAAIRPPTVNGWLLLAWAGGGALWLWRARRIGRGPALAYGLLGAILLWLPLGGAFTAREALRAAYQTWRELRFYLPALVSLAGWGLLWCRRVPAKHQAPLALLLAYGAWNLMQVYPFADSNHLLWSIQPAFIGLAYLAYQLWCALREKVAGAAAHWAPAVATGILAAVLIALQIYPLIGHFYTLERGPRPVQYDLLDPPRADVYVRHDAGRRLRAVSQFIVNRAGDGQTIFDTSGSLFYFLTRRDNATRQDSFWPGYLTDEDVAQAVRDLETRRPAVVICRETDENVFGYASFAQNYPAIAGYIERSYELDVRVGEYALWVPRHRPVGE